MHKVPTYFALLFVIATNTFNSDLTVYASASDGFAARLKVCTLPLCADDDQQQLNTSVCVFFGTY